MAVSGARAKHHFSLLAIVMGEARCDAPPDGIGSILLGAAIKVCEKRRDVPRIKLEVGTENARRPEPEQLFLAVPGRRGRPRRLQCCVGRLYKN